MKTLINFCIALAVIGCIPVNTHYGSDLSSMDTFTIERDKTTEQELIDRLGKPQTSNVSADGTKILIWQDMRGKGKVNAATAIPGVGLFQRTVENDMTGRTLTVTIRNGKVVDYTLSDTASKL